MRRLILVLLIVGLTAGCISASTPSIGEPGVASRFVWAQPFPRLLIEIDHVEGYAPSMATVDHLVRTLANVTDKRSIEVLPFEQLPRRTLVTNVPYQWTHDELVATAAAHLDSAPPGQHTSGDYAVIHVLFLDGEYPGAIGLAIDRTAFLFEPSGYQTELYEHGPAGELVQRRLLLHEVGHVIGLVNRGIPMVRDHAHPNDPHHSANPRSVMWAGLKDMDVIRGLLNEKDGPPAEFDADDLADLAAFRKEGRRWAAANGYS